MVGSDRAFPLLCISTTPRWPSIQLVLQHSDNYFTFTSSCFALYLFCHDFGTGINCIFLAVQPVQCIRHDNTNFNERMMWCVTCVLSSISPALTASHIQCRWHHYIPASPPNFFPERSLLHKFSIAGVTACRSLTFFG
jgi:hypothetical protein